MEDMDEKNKKWIQQMAKKAKNLENAKTLGQQKKDVHNMLDLMSEYQHTSLLDGINVTRSDIGVIINGGSDIGGRYNKNCGIVVWYCKLEGGWDI